MSSSASFSPDSSLAILKRMPDESLLASLRMLVAKQSRLTAELLAHVAEVEARKLHLVQGYGCMFTFCVKGLGLSEAMAYKYIGVARAARKHKAIFTMVAAGELHLSAAMMLAPHLTDENRSELLEAAAGQSKRQVEKLLAERFPKADVPSQMRKLPQPPQSIKGHSAKAGPPMQGQITVGTALATCEPATNVCTSGDGQVAAPAFDEGARAKSTGTGSSASNGSQEETKPTQVASPLLAEPVRPRIEPLAPSRYKVQFTASEQLHRKLQQAQELLRHQVPDGDLAVVCERALDLLIASLMKKRFAFGKSKNAGVPPQEPAVSPPAEAGHRDGNPSVLVERAAREPEKVAREANEDGARSAKKDMASSGDKTATLASSDGQAAVDDGVTRPEPASRSRYIPASVRRQVAERDGLQCTYLGPDGNRCESMDVEFHHLTPFARGGEHKAEEITLRCRAHNHFQAELDYGEHHIARRICERRERSTRHLAERERAASMVRPAQ